MKKTLGILFLALLLTTATVSAASIEKIYGINANEYPPVSKELPLVAECIVKKAYVRNEPNASADIITALQKNDIIYVHTPLIKATQSKTKWYEITTFDGTHGYIRADFVKHNPDKLDFKYRFEAAFNSSVLFDVDQLRDATNYADSLKEISPKSDGYATHATEFTKGLTVKSMNLGDYRTALNSVEVRTPNYTVAGLKVGDDFNNDTISYISEGMKQMNWSFYGTIEHEQNYALWLFKAKRGTTLVPIKGFRVYYQAGKITGFYWYRHIED